MDSWESLFEEQQTIETRYRKLLQEQSGAESLVQELNEAFASGNPDLEALKRRTRAWSENHRSFQNDMDNFTGRIYERFIADYSPEQLEKQIAELQPVLNDTERERVSAALANLREAAKNVEASRAELVGKPEDRKRLESVNAYMRSVAEVYSATSSAERKPKVAQFMDNIRSKVHKVQDLAALATSVPSILNAFRTGTGLLDATRNQQRIEYFLKGYSTDLQGKEHIIPGTTANPKEGEEKVLNIFIPEHASFKDAWVVTELSRGKENSRLMAAKNLLAFMRDFGGYPQSVIDKIEASNSILWTADGIRRPLNPMIDDIEAGKPIENLIIFAEGTMPTDLAYERRPILQALGRILLPGITRKGIKVRIYPVSLPDNHRMAGTDRDPIVPKSISAQHPDIPFDSKHLNGIIHRPISPEVVEFLLEEVGHTALETLIRQHYYEGADKVYGDKRFIGAPRLPQLREMVQLRMDHLCNDAMGRMAE